MKLYAETECRRCGNHPEEVVQLIDNQGSWAATTTYCTCGHLWTTVHAAPPNLSILRRWVERGSAHLEGIQVKRLPIPWRSCRIEGRALDLVGSPLPWAHSS